MKQFAFLVVFSLGFLPIIAFANCDLRQFRWGCEMNIHPTKTAQATTLVYCGSSFGYVTPGQAAILARYVRRSIHHSLYIHGEYIDSPCVPMTVP